MQHRRRHRVDALEPLEDQQRIAFEQTQAEFWFKDAEAAEAAGFEPAGGADKQQVEDEA